MSNARVHLPPGLRELSRTEMQTCIEEANLGEYDTGIASRYLISQWRQIDIAAELGCVPSTVSSHVAYILERVSATAKRLRLT